MEDPAQVLVLLSLDVGAEADALLVHALFDDLLQTVKGTAADEEDVLGVHLDELLVGVLPAALGRHVGHSALYDLQQGLLHALTGDVPGDGSVLALAGDLVDFIHVDDAPLGPLHVEVGGLQQAQQDVLHVVAHVAGLSEGGSIGDGEGHLQDPGQSLGKEGLAGACGAQHQNVALLQLHILVAAEENTLIVVVNRHGQGHFRLILANDVLIQHVLDLPGGRQLIRDIVHRAAVQIVESVIENAHAKPHTFIADPHAGPLDHPANLLLVLAAEGAAKGLLAVVVHGITSVSGVALLR